MVPGHALGAINPLYQLPVGVGLRPDSIVALELAKIAGGIGFHKTTCPILEKLPFSAIAFYW